MEITFLYGSQNSYFDVLTYFNNFIKKFSCTQYALKCQKPKCVVSWTSKQGPNFFEENLKIFLTTEKN